MDSCFPAHELQFLEDVQAACARILAGDHTGSGYFLDRQDLVVTCAHVVRDVGLRGTVRVVPEVSGEAVEGLVILLPADGDVAVIQLAGVVSGVRPLELGMACRGGDAWLSYGYPELVEQQHGLPFFGLIMLRCWPSRRPSSRVLWSPQAAAGLASPMYGLSGSPLVVGRKVVGHLSNVLVDPGTAAGRPMFGAVLAVPSETIRDVLDGLAAADPTPPLDVSSEFMESVMDAAARMDKGGLMAVGRSWPEGRLKAAEDLIKLGHPDLAIELLATESASLRRDQLRALALSRTGQNEAAIRILEALWDAGARDAETGGILGGRYKAMWERTCDVRWLFHAYETYLETFKQSRDAYPGINAAALALRIDDRRAESRPLAATVLRITEEKRPASPDHWWYATRGEAHLLLGDLDAARDQYRHAAAAAHRWDQDIAVMRHQARRNLGVLGYAESLFDDYLPVPRTIAFTGHRADDPGRQPPRLPASRIGALRLAIRAKLKELGGGFAYCSAASGSDLVFLEELMDQEGRARVFLPFPAEDFYLVSVGPEWRQKYWDVLNSPKITATVLMDRVPSTAEFPRAFARCNQEIQRAAIRRAKSLDQTPYLLAVWDEQPSSSAGGTADFVRSWQQEGHELHVLAP